MQNYELRSKRFEINLNLYFYFKRLFYFIVPFVKISLKYIKKIQKMSHLRSFNLAFKTVHNFSSFQPTYLVAGKRTPVGSLNGKLSKVRAPLLTASCIKAALESIKLSGSEVEEVVVGSVIQAGTGPNPARIAALKGGIFIFFEKSEFSYFFCLKSKIFDFFRLKCDFFIFFMFLSIFFHRSWISCQLHYCQQIVFFWYHGCL